MKGPKKQMHSFYMTSDLLAEVRLITKKKGMSISSFITSAVENYINPFGLTDRAKAKFAENTAETEITIYEFAKQAVIEKLFPQKEKLSIVPLIAWAETITWGDTKKSPDPFPGRKWSSPFSKLDEGGFALVGKEEYSPVFDKEALLFFNTKGEPADNHWVLFLGADQSPTIGRLVKEKETFRIVNFPGHKKLDIPFLSVKILGYLVERAQNT